MQKLPVILLGVGVGIAIIGVLVGWVVFPAVIKSKVSKQIRLEKDGDTYKKWENIPIPIFMKMYLFNVTNPEEIVLGGIPVVEEIGPYVYEQKRRKVNITIHEDTDTVDYAQLIDYYFRPDLSNGTEDDPIQMVNLPYVGFAIRLKKQGPAAIGLVAEEFNEVHPKEPVFINLTVGQFLFKGWHVEIMKTLTEILGRELLPNNTYGLYYGKNGTTKDTLSVHAGVMDNTKFGNIATFNGKPELEFWNDDPYCNMINGSDGALFPPFVTRDRRLDVFSPDLCRSLYLTYDSDVEVHGLKGLRFTLPEEELEDPRIREENRCFCTYPGNNLDECPRRGAYQLESCRAGAPVVVSLPHFLDGDPEYLNETLGLSPIREEHETFITLEPTTGVLLEARKRIQINLAIQPIKFMKPLKKLPKVLLPLVWIDEAAALTEESAERIKGKLLKPQEIVGAASWGIVGLGCFLILIAFVVFLLRARKRDYKP